MIVLGMHPHRVGYCPGQEWQANFYDDSRNTLLPGQNLSRSRIRLEQSLDLCIGQEGSSWRYPSQSSFQFGTEFPPTLDWYNEKTRPNCWATIGNLVTGDGQD